MRPAAAALMLAAAGLLPVPAARHELPVPSVRGAARFDAPDQAAAFARAKRLGEEGTVFDAPAAYRAARERWERMPRYSTRRGELLEVAGPGGRAAAAGGELEWSALGPGNIGGRTRVLVIHPRKTRTMYAAGVSGGIWKTRDGGRSWKPIADDLANIAVNSLAMDPRDPQVLYAGTGEGYFREEVRGTALPLRGGGIFKSENAGRTWTRLASTRGKAFHWVNDLVVSPHEPARVYAATRKGVYRSLDGGGSWRRVLKGRVKSGGCLDLAVRGDGATDYLFASCGTFRRAAVWRNLAAEGEGGWEKVLSEPAMGRTSLAIAPSDPDVVYALAASNVPGPGGRFEQALHAVFRSSAGGAEGSWEARVRNTDRRKINTLILHNAIIAMLEECGFTGANEHFAMGWYVNVIAVDPSDPDRVWAGGVDLFRSDDGGRNWNPATYWWADIGPSIVHADQHGIVFHPKKPTTMFALNDGGIYFTDSASAPVATDDLAVCRPGSAPTMTWSTLNRGYGVTQFYHGLPFPGGERYLGGTQDNGTVIGSDRLGHDLWTRIFGGDGGYSAIDPGDPDVLYVTFQNGAIRKSTDGGFRFFEAVNGIDDLDESDTADFRGTRSGFLFIAPLLMDPNDSQRLWSGGRRLWRTDNGAARWSAASAPLADGGKASALAVAPGDSDLVLAGDHRGTIYRRGDATATDGDSAWPGVRPRKGFVSSLSFDPRDPRVAYATYAGFGGKHVWRSRDGGRSWQAIDGSGDTGVPDIPVHSLVVDPNDPRRLYLGTDLGVFVSLDGGASWAVENTGFATAVTESLSLAETAAGDTLLFAFTHGRGAWRVRL